MSEGYQYKSRKTGEVAIFHHGRLAVLLKDKQAEAFLKNVKKGDAQQVMAEAAGHTHPDRPGVSAGGTGQHLHRDATGHAHKEFRRKTG